MPAASQIPATAFCLSMSLSAPTSPDETGFPRGREPAPERPGMYLQMNVVT